MIKPLIKAAIFTATFALTGTVFYVDAQSEVKADYASRRAGATRMIALYNLATGSEEDCPTPFEYKGTIVKTKYDDDLGTKIIGFTIADRNNKRTYFNIDEDLYNDFKLPRVDMDWINTLITAGRQVGVSAYGCGASGRVLMANNIVDLAFVKNTASKNVTLPKPDVTGWETARWGMKSEDLDKVFQGRLKKSSPPPWNGIPYISGELKNYVFGNQQMRVVFWMDGNTNTLSKVSLDTQAGGYSLDKQSKFLSIFNDFEKLLINKYGKLYQISDSKNEDLIHKERLWILPSGTAKLEYIADVSGLIMVHIDYSVIAKK